MHASLIQKNRENLPFFQFPNLAECSGIVHGIFSRHGGVSTGPYKSLNVGLGTGDKRKLVHTNRQLIAQCLNQKKMVFAKQEHGTDVHVLSASDMASMAGGNKRIFHCDALVTDIPGTALAIQVADCQAVLLYDPQKHVAANIHSGWRGSVGDIIGKTIQVMKENFKCSGRDMMAGIGPSLGPCCAEFIHYKNEIPEMFWIYKDDSDHFDFWSVSVDQLCSSGILHENICVSSVCTKCNGDFFYSYRQEKDTGRFAVVIGLV